MEKGKSLDPARTLCPNENQGGNTRRTAHGELLLQRVLGGAQGILPLAHVFDSLTQSFACLTLSDCLVSLLATNEQNNQDFPSGGRS